MSIVLDENIIGIWFIHVTEDSDWLGSLAKTDDGFKVTYRHRYYVDDKMHDSEDKKSWYEGTISSEKCPHKEQAIAEMQRIVGLMSLMCNEPIIEELMGPEGLSEFMERFQKLPFVHMKVVTSENETLH